MPKKPSQPVLISEERAEYKISPEEQARKDEYRARLKTFLEDPASRQIEGFPIGEVDDILALSDPPYYTACPNPFLAEIIQQWTKEREANQKSETLALHASAGVENRKYHREPFAADVSEGKNDPIYNAHSYHTKVPHKAIMRYILHYTEPGDIVFDGFCGTGMTGVSAQLCGDKKTVESLGYHVTDAGEVYEDNKLISKLGVRKAVLNDLSPAATFIAYNYNTPIDILAFEREAKRILEEVEEECGWMYETLHTDGKTKGKINYTVWSEVFSCPSCAHEIVFSQEALDEGHVKDEFPCPNCKVQLNKSSLELLFETYVDKTTKEITKRPRRQPILISYLVNKKKFEKKPDELDYEMLEQVASLEIPPEVPLLKLPPMQMGRVGRMKTTGVTYIRHFFLERQAQSLAKLWQKAQEQQNLRLRHFLLFFIEQAISGMSILNRYQPIQFGRLGGSQVNRALSGVFYVASQIAEVSPWYNLSGKLRRLVGAFKTSGGLLSTASVTTENLGSVNLLENSVDYIFTDPPFGENIYYSDLNILTESWHGVLTAPNREAIVDRVKGKDFQDYEQLMMECFTSYYRVLKPGHWMTVEFHNSKNSVWNAIQLALQQSGFIIADVRTLNKKQGSFQQVTSTSAVKQDLVISAYKPNDNLEDRFRLEAGTLEGAWDFVRYHLTQLPRVVEKNAEVEVVTERQDYLLFDRMVAFHIQRGASIPLSAGEFYAGLKQKFVERDGMYFLPDQVAEYDAARLRLGKVAQLALFVSDEKSAIQWLRQQLDPTLGGELQTFAELQPKFMRGSNPAKHEQMPELGIILEQNFLQDETGKWYSPDPSKATDLEHLRLKALLREFDEYVKSTGRLKQFRTEAVRAGFAEAYKKREYKVILEVAGRLPESVLHEDPDLLMYFDTATLRTGQ